VQAHARTRAHTYTYTHTQSHITLAHTQAHAHPRHHTAHATQVTGHEGYRKAEVTGGGVPLSDINCATMESKALPGLYLVGEICDVFGRIGGSWVVGEGAHPSCEPCVQSGPARLVAQLRSHGNTLLKQCRGRWMRMPCSSCGTSSLWATNSSLAAATSRRELQRGAAPAPFPSPLPCRRLQLLLGVGERAAGGAGGGQGGGSHAWTRGGAVHALTLTNWHRPSS